MWIKRIYAQEEKMTSGEVGYFITYQKNNFQAMGKGVRDKHSSRSKRKDVHEEKGVNP